MGGGGLCHTTTHTTFPHHYLLLFLCHCYSLPYYLTHFYRPMVLLPYLGWCRTRCCVIPEHSLQCVPHNYLQPTHLVRAHTALFHTPTCLHLRTTQPHCSLSHALCNATCPHYHTYLHTPTILYMHCPFLHTSCLPHYAHLAGLPCLHSHCNTPYVHHTHRLPHLHATTATPLPPWLFAVAHRRRHGWFGYRARFTTRPQAGWVRSLFSHPQHMLPTGHTYTLRHLTVYSHAPTHQLHLPPRATFILYHVLVPTTYTDACCGVWHCLPDRSMDRVSLPRC